jgi:FMN phosphatase YigB (HAD superfamily)
MKKIILFDLEGTLVKSGYQIDPFLLKMLHKDTKKFLIKIGIPESILKKINKSVYLRNKALEWSEKNLPFKDYLKIRDKIEKFMLKYDIVAAKASVIYPETVITLNKLKKDNIKMCIITNTSKKATYHIIDLSLN